MTGAVLSPQKLPGLDVVRTSLPGRIEWHDAPNQRGAGRQVNWHGLESSGVDVATNVSTCHC